MPKKAAKRSAEAEPDPGSHRAEVKKVKVEYGDNAAIDAPEDFEANCKKADEVRRRIDRILI